ncbi:MAG: hypothetical protein LBJ19_01550 [Holosporaceae bacterium]|jgi:hypothetical protein|nr:hypothetical protein [Holosporaceae bacterium]
MKIFLFFLSLIFSVENISAMAWGVENRSHENSTFYLPATTMLTLLYPAMKDPGYLWKKNSESSSKKMETNSAIRDWGTVIQKQKRTRKPLRLSPRIENWFAEELREVFQFTELAEIIKTQKVVFYTGAEISAGAVPTMDEVMNDLKISQKLKDGRNLQNYIAEIIKNPGRYVEILRRFYDRCENAEPTVAHRAISENGATL